MMMPAECRPEAFELFAQQIPIIETTDGLLRAAMAIAMHAFDDLDPQREDDQLHAMADRVRQRVKGRQVQAVLAHLHAVLFDEEGFAGDLEDYYNPLHCYLPVVLETRTGIPVTLSLVYKVVADRAGLHVEGVNAPGHFLTRVHGAGGSMLVDPFFRGQVLSPQEAYRRIEQRTGWTPPAGQDVLRTVTHRQWIRRILHNLQRFLASERRTHDLAAMSELESLLNLPP